MTISTDLSPIRERFPATRRHAYFMTNSLGLMPDSVPQALAEMMEVWNAEGADAWETWVPLSRRVADQVGRLIGAPPGSVAMHLNVSSLMAMVLSSFDFRATRRNKIVCTEMDFPTLAHLADTWRSYGARFEVVRSRDGIGIELADLEAAIDEETLLVVTCHGFFGSACLQDMRAITERAHAVRALVVADVYQTVGAMPIDVTAWGVDMAVGGSHKYLCGGTGAGFLYVRPDLIEGLEPRVTGWLSHARAFEMRVEPMDWAAGMQRFMGGTPAVAPLYVAPCGYALIEQVGLARIREESVRHTERIVALADELGLELRSPREAARRGPAVHVRFPGVERAQAALRAQGFRVHYRDAYQGLRIAPHFYNTIEEIDRLMAAIGELAR